MLTITISYTQHKQHSLAAEIPPGPAAESTDFEEAGLIGPAGVGKSAALAISSKRFVATSLIANMLRKVGLGACACGGGAAVYVYQDPGLSRQSVFWAKVGQGVVHYTYTKKMHDFYEWKGEAVEKDVRKEDFKKLHDQYAPAGLDLILSLRGLYIKFGQAASVSPFVPDAYRNMFKQLQSDVPSENFDLIRTVVESELGPLEDVFESFSEVPCGAASIGQAHVAKIKATGEEVVVKVQYPDAATVFTADMQCLRALVKMAQPDALPAFDDFGEALSAELDYNAEVVNLDEIYAAVMPTYGGRVAVPRTKKEYCSSKVITMEYLQGPKLEAEIRAQMRALGMKVDESESLRDWLERLNKQREEAAGETATSTAARGSADGSVNGSADGPTTKATTELQPKSSTPQLWLQLLKVVGLDRALWLSDLLVDLRSWLLGALTGSGTVVQAAAAPTNEAMSASPDQAPGGAKEVTFDTSENSDGVGEGGKVATAADRKRMRECVRTLVDVHGYEIFVIGLFNTDPHPGNLIFMQVLSPPPHPPPFFPPLISAI
jgi:aarF domain-containing kinase